MTTTFHYPDWMTHERVEQRATLDASRHFTAPSLTFERGERDWWAVRIDYEGEKT